MGEQTLQQTIHITVGNGGLLASTGISVLGIITLALSLLMLGLTVYFYILRRTHKVSFQTVKNLTAFTLLALSLTSLAFNLPTVSAAPTLTLSANQQNLNITVPKGGGTATTTTTITTSTLNDTGYTLTASLEAEEPGIGIELKGGDITTNTALTAGETPLTLTTTTEANSEDPESSSATDTTEATLTFTIDNTVTEGTKQLKLIYKATDNEAAPVPAPLTMQTMTADYCASHMTIYDGTNPSAILTLTDTRADQQTYEVAKLADGNCWMLENLKVGSTSSSITLTPSDSDVGSNFTLPQVVATGDLSYDEPRAYGPVPGDTGSGATNYGYLYNWWAVTAAAQTMWEEAPYSICPANWRLPSAYLEDYVNLDRAFGGTGEWTHNGEPSIAQWQHNGPFKGTFASNYGWDGFGTHGYDQGFLWTRSPGQFELPGLIIMRFSADLSDAYARGEELLGYGVRCLLK